MSLATIQEFRQRYPIRPNDDAFILGSGSYGKVVKVEDQVETEWVAVKIGEFKGDDSKSLRAEVTLARKIPRHPNIARYDECYRYETDTSVCDFAIMRYYPDGNLAMLMKHTSLTPTQKEEIVRGILLGLQHLHRQRIVHRDFKPANILISRDNQGRFVPKIADFGLSKLVQEDEIDSSDFDLSDGRGTPSYKAPEQITGGKVSFNLDLWAFGVILFELFTGEKPFMASQKSGSEHVMKREIEKKIVSVALPESVHRVPEPYQALIRRCLVKDVRKRARREDELLDLLDGIPGLLNEAEQLVREQNFEEALARYETILARRENHPKATEGLKAAQELARKRERSGVALLPEADAMFFRQAYTEARTVYETVLKSDPQNATAKRQLAACDAALHQQRIDKLWIEAEHFQNLNKFESAKAKYAEVLQLDANHFLAHTRLGEIEALEQQHKVTTLLAEADGFFARNDYAKAKPVYEAVLAMESQNETARRQLANLAAAQRRQRIDEQVALAQKMLSQKQYAQARTAFEKIRTEDKNNEAARLGLATCAAALAPPPLPESERTDVYEVESVDDRTDLFEETVPVKPKAAVSLPPSRPVPRSGMNEPTAVPKPVRAAAGLRPVYVWVSGLVMVLFVGGFFWMKRGPELKVASPVPAPATGIKDAATPARTRAGAGTVPPATSPAPSTDPLAARRQQYTVMIQQARISLKFNELSKAKSYLAQAQALNPAGREVKVIGLAIQSLEKELATKTEGTTVNEIASRSESNDQKSAPLQNELVSEVPKARMENPVPESPTTQTLQVQYNELITKGADAINSGNRKGAAINLFKQARQLAQANNLSTTNALKLVAGYVAKGDRLFQIEDPDGAKAWYQVAQAIQESDELRRKIQACN